MKDIKCKIKSDIKQLYDDIRSRLNLKKMLLPNLPYLLVFWLIDKLTQSYRIMGGNNLFEKIIAYSNSVNMVFERPILSFNGCDLLCGLIGTILVRFFIWQKSKNAKKYRKGV